MFPSPKRRRGFTLVEVLLVLVILVIIGSLVVVNYGPIQQRAKENAAKAQINAFEVPLDTYRLDVGDYPVTAQGLDALRQAPSDLTDPEAWNGPYLKKPVPPDPWGRPYQYEYPGNQNADMPDIWSLGKDGADGTEDDVVNWFEE